MTICTIRFLFAVRAEGSSLQAPLCPPPRPVPKVMEHTKEITKEITKDSRPEITLLLRGRHEGERGEKKRLFLTPGTKLLRLHPPLLFPFPPLQRLSTKRSRILNWSLPLPVSLRTSTYKIFCVFRADSA